MQIKVYWEVSLKSHLTYWELFLVQSNWIAIKPNMASYKKIQQQKNPTKKQRNKQPKIFIPVASKMK